MAKRTSNNQKAINQPVEQAQPAQVETTAPNGMTQRLGKGLWGTVGNKTRHGIVTQFSGLEYVRYEYRRIPEQYREAAMKNDFIDVLEITEDPAVEEEVISIEVEPEASLPVDEDPAEG